MPVVSAPLTASAIGGEVGADGSILVTAANVGVLGLVLDLVTMAIGGVVGEFGAGVNLGGELFGELVTAAIGGEV